MSESRVINILVADDHPFFVAGLVANLETEPDLVVVGRAGNGRQAIDLFHELRPDVVMMDLSMPIMNGVDAIKEILRQQPNARIIVLTTYDGDEDIHRALKAGASGYLLKDVFREELLAAVRAVHAGKRHIPSQVAGKLVDRLATGELTEREVSVLRLIAGGKSNREIADALGIAEGTVKAHVNNILNKLNANDRTQAAMIALQRGILRFE